MAFALFEVIKWDLSLLGELDEWYVAEKIFFI
jgi:hypothetical protein